MSTEANTTLLEVGGLELDTSSLVHAEHGQERAHEASLSVDLVLLLGVGSAERRVERTGDGGLTHAVGLLVDEASAARLGPAARRRVRRSVGLLVVTVGANDDDLESILVLTGVGSRLCGDVLAPERALEAGDGGRRGARALAGVELRITLNEDVEASAGLGRFALGGASSRVVGSEFVVPQVSATRDRGAQVSESLGVAGRSLGRNSKLVQSSVVLEGISSVGSDMRSVGVGLSSARVFRVDKSTVGTNLNIGSTTRGSGESESVSPANWSAGRWGHVGRRLVGRRQSTARNRRLGRGRARWGRARWWSSRIRSRRLA